MSEDPKLTPEQREEASGVISQFNAQLGESLSSALQFLGITDPAVDPDGVREVAEEWRRLARASRTAADAAASSLSGVTWEGDAAQAYQERVSASAQQARTLAETLDKGAVAIDSFADTAEGLLDEIGVIIVEIIEVEVAAAVLGFFTAGIATAAGQIAAGARAARILVLIRRIVEEAQAASAVVRGVVSAVARLRVGLGAMSRIPAVAQLGKVAAVGARDGLLYDALFNPEGLSSSPEQTVEHMLTGALMGAGVHGAGMGLSRAFRRMSPTELTHVTQALGKPRGTTPAAADARVPAARAGTESRAESAKSCVGDPIDVAVGDMVLSSTDLVLPGILPVVLSRTHLSTFRAGGWFGSSWASLLDTRLQIEWDGDAVAAAHLVRWDTVRLRYDTPAPGVALFPVRGDRWPLTLADDFSKERTQAEITDPISGVTYTFEDVSGGLAEPLQPHLHDLALTGLRDRNGNAATFDYSVAGVPMALNHTGGYRVVFDRCPDIARIKSVRVFGEGEDWDGFGHQVASYAYDERGRLAQVRNCSSRPLTFSYDDDDRIIRWEDANGTFYRYDFDDEGRVAHAYGTGGSLDVTLEYADLPGGARRTLVTNSRGHTSEHLSNADGRPVAMTDPLGGTVRTEYTDDGDLIAAQTDELGRTHRVEYDPLGRPQTLVRPDGGAVVRSWAGDGQVLRTALPDGAVWTRTFDEKGNLLTSVDPTGVTERCEYDSAGRLTALISPAGETTRIECNAAGLPVKVTDARGHSTVMERDWLGRLTSVTRPDGESQRYGYDAWGQLIWAEDAFGARQTWEWDREGNLLTHTDAEGRTTSFTYTFFDLVSTKTDPDGGVFEFEYDTELALVCVRNPAGLTWTYEYDAGGRLTAETDFNDRTLTYEYDAAGQLIRRTNAVGQEVAFEYNALGDPIRRWVGAEKPDALLTELDYDLAGRLVAARKEGLDQCFTYDLAGRQLSETVNGRMMQSELDDHGRQSTRITPGGLRSAYTLNASDARTGLMLGGGSSGLKVSTDRDPEGRATRVHFSTGVSLEHEFDPNGQLVAQTLDRILDETRPERVLSRSWRYTPAGNVARMVDSGGGSTTFENDPLGRVTSLMRRSPDGPDGRDEHYRYDASGNIVSFEGEARDVKGTYVTEAGAVRYHWDAQGRVIRKIRRRLSRKPAVTEFEWDADDRLITVRVPDGITWTYLYDSLGRRVSKEHWVDGVLTDRVLFAWDGMLLVEQETVLGERDGECLTWEYDGLVPIAQVRSRSFEGSSGEDRSTVDREFFAIVAGLSGAPSEMIDGAGRVVWQSRRGLWGQPADGPGGTLLDAPVEMLLGFAGQYLDAETGLFYNVNRYYDPWIGGYLSQDPLGLAPAPNSTRFVLNPLVWMDPLGLGPCENRQSGNAFRDYIYREMGGDLDPGIVKEKYFMTRAGVRFVDISDGTEYLILETKVGRVGLNRRIQQQISKDLLIVQDPGFEARAAKWIFARSATTDKLGPTPRLEKRLKEL